MKRLLSDTIVAELKDIGQAEDLLGKQLARLRSRRNHLLKEHTEPAERQVTDHAIVRFLERIDGVDMELVKSRIRAYVDACEPTSVRGIFAHPSGMQMVVNKTGVIVTLLPPGTAHVPYQPNGWEAEKELAAS